MRPELPIKGKSLLDLPICKDCDVSALRSFQQIDVEIGVYTSVYCKHTKACFRAYLAGKNEKESQS